MDDHECGENQMKHHSRKRPISLFVAAALVALAATSVYIGLDNAQKDAANASGETLPHPKAPSVRRTQAAANGRAASDGAVTSVPTDALTRVLAGKTPADPSLASMWPEMRFAAEVLSLNEAPYSEKVARARRLLRSQSPQDRAKGGALLFLAGALTEDDIGKIASDRALLVPLVVCEWIRDFGTDEESSAFLARLRGRTVSDTELLAAINASATTPGGGRTALDLLIPRLEDDEELADTLETALAGKGISHDLREQLLFKFLEPENKAQGIALLERLAKGAGAEGSLLAQSVAKWQELAALPPENDDGDLATAPSDADDDEAGEEDSDADDDGADDDDEDDDASPDYKVWDTPIRDISFLASSDLGLAVRTMANYIEYGLRRDDPDFEPVIEEGAYEIARAFYEDALARSASLRPEELFALNRLAAGIDRLALYDPAFAPDGDEDDGEEIPAEVLDEEDAYVADMLAEEDDEDADEDDAAESDESDEDADAEDDDNDDSSDSDDDTDEES